MISTRDLSTLPPVDTLRRLMQSLAMLDAILSPEWDRRYFSFNSKWAPGQQMGSMRNGSGDHYFALFNTAGCWLKGFAHESSLSPFRHDKPEVAAGMFKNMPADFSACLQEPAFVLEETTFCIWRRPIDSVWQRGTVALPKSTPDPDGSANLLKYLDGNPETYVNFAAEYYEIDVPLQSVRALYDHQSLGSKLLSTLNASMRAGDLKKDAAEIGYPHP
jgi:hypothetical protein